MDNHFFNKTLEEQLNILKNENFYNKQELEQTEILRNCGFFNLPLNQRIKFLEDVGLFHLDVNDDPPTIPLTLDQVDYLTKKTTSKINRTIAYSSASKFLNSLLKDKKLIIKEIKGIENLQNMDSGAILTCNHFNPFDVFTLEKIFRDSGQDKKRKLYKVIREGNYTNFPGLYGFLFKNCDTLPLASNKHVMIEFMKAVNVILQRGDFILIYPEQSMWLNYKKPKPLQNGAFKLAVKNKCPIIPIFICFENSDVIGEDGFPVQAYTIHIEKPIFYNKDLTDRENVELMKNTNYNIWKNIYEDFYKLPLIYSTKKILEATNGK